MPANCAAHAQTGAGTADRATLRGVRRYRLTGQGAFEGIFEAGRRRDGEYLQLVYCPAQRSPGRVGFVLGKKTLARAVDRNRVKRMLRAVLEAARPEIEGYDIIVRLKKRCSREAFPLVVAEARRLLAALPPFVTP